MQDNIRSQQIQAIIDRADILEVVENFEILKKKGRNYVCKCPLPNHREKNPSFTVSRARNYFKCYGCEAGGDCVDFLKAYLNLDFIQAIKWLSDFYKMPLDDSAPRTYTSIKKTAISKLESPVTYIPRELFSKSLCNPDNNNFVKFLHTLFDENIVNGLIEKYYIGSSRQYPGWVIFWQVDNQDNVRYGKMMGYNPETGKRIKEPSPLVTSVNAAIIKQYEKAAQTPPEWVVKYDSQDIKPLCLFGLHLIDGDKTKPIAVVESEKTCMVASVFFPQFTWVATALKNYTKYNAKNEINSITDQLSGKFKPLYGYKVILFPDLGAGEDWQELANQLTPYVPGISVSNLLQTMAENYQLPDKSDLCDYLTSEAAKRELMDDFKQTLADEREESGTAQWAIWLQFRAKGLRVKDRIAACKELIADNIFHVE